MVWKNRRREGRSESNLAFGDRYLSTYGVGSSRYIYTVLVHTVLVHMVRTDTYLIPWNGRMISLEPYKMRHVF